MVSVNTDEASEPEEKFINYFEKQKYMNMFKKNLNHVGFQETKSLIEEYAEIN